MWGLDGIETIDVHIGNDFPIYVSHRRLHEDQHCSGVGGEACEFEGVRGLRISYFDEVHRLKFRSMDQVLLNAVQDTNDLWLFSTAKPELLEQMFLNRLIKLSTQLPEAKEFESWLVDRC